MKFIASSICKQGGREYNQDYEGFSILPSASAFVVCDGLGSYVGSEVASRLCVQSIIDNHNCKFASNNAIINDESAKTAILQAHNYVSQFKEQNPAIKSSCTTVATVISNLDTSILAHIGDSRIYFFSQGKLAYQSKDHSMAQYAVDRGEIALRDIRTHKDQNKLTRVLGSDYYAPPDIQTIPVPLRAGDSFLICTDGFWEYVYEEEMEIDIRLTMGNPKLGIDAMEARLMKRIPIYNDNYTAILVMVVND